MLKYLYCKEVFSEVPREISLGISISGCQIRCKGCHSRELWEDKGEPLTVESVGKLLKQHEGVTCLLLLGGEHDIDTLIEIFKTYHGKIKTAWYCGLDMMPRMEMVRYLDYYKIGHYDIDLGGLSSSTTNQRLYAVEHLGNGDYWENDITYLLTKDGR